MENEKSVCTLKTPAAGLGRNEIELECGSIEDAIPVLCVSGAPEDFGSLVQDGVIAVCSAKFHRTAITLALEDFTIELALDTGTLSGGNQTIPLCEVEVEHKAGDMLSSELFAAILQKNYGLVQEERSKFRRALALYKGEKL
jgi:inorganic triphosphatase YgiF